MSRFFLILLLSLSIVQQASTQVVNSGSLRRAIAEAAARESNKWTDIYVDSPLYVGIVNRVKVKEFNTGNYVFGNDQVIKNAGEPDEFIIPANEPGEMNIPLRDRATGKTVYVYHYIVKRLRAYEINEPRIIFGDSISHRIDISSLRKLKKISVTNGFNFVSATVYFTIPGSRYVITVTFKDGSAPPIDSILRLCEVGSTIIFDNVKVTDSKRKEYSIASPLFTVTDSPANSLIPDALTELYTLLSKEFRSGTIYIAGQPHTNAEVVAARDSRSARVANIIARCTPGSVITFENCVYLDIETGKSVTVDKVIKL